jgi:hypothetical protein
MAETIKHRLVHPTEGKRLNRGYEQMTTDDLKAVDYARSDDDGRRPRPPHTVFLSRLDFGYEGDEILGVYRTREAAQASIDRAKEAGRYYDSTAIDEYTVEE